jgi:hypothetical protein
MHLPQDIISHLRMHEKCVSVSKRFLLFLKTVFYISFNIHFPQDIISYLKKSQCLNDAVWIEEFFYSSRTGSVEQDTSLYKLTFLSTSIMRRRS